MTKLQFKEWNINEIREWLTNKDYVYNNLVLDTPNIIKPLWPELNKCCIINAVYDHFINENIDKFIKENEITLERLKDTLIVPWEKDNSAFFKFKLKSLENFDSPIKHIFDYNFRACLILLKQFIKSCCKSASVFEIQEYYDYISLFKEKIKQRYSNLNNWINSRNDSPDNYAHKSPPAWFFNCDLSKIDNAFIDIDMYFKNILFLIQNIINKTKADNEEEKFNKVFKQNKWLGWVAIIVSGAGVISGIIVPLIIKFCFK